MNKEATKTSDVISDALIERLNEVADKASANFDEEVVSPRLASRHETYWYGYKDAIEGVISCLDGDEEGLI